MTANSQNNHEQKEQNYTTEQNIVQNYNNKTSNILIQKQAYRAIE